MKSRSAPVEVPPEAMGALAALRRARKQAERIALATGTKLVVAVDGKPVLVDPRPEAALDDDDRDEG